MSLPWTLWLQLWMEVRAATGMLVTHAYPGGKEDLENLSRLPVLRICCLKWSEVIICTNLVTQSKIILEL